jgi:hypothetical protein
MHLIRAGRNGVRGVLAVACLCVLGGCVSTRPQAAAELVVKPVAVRDARGAYRFDMSQNGKRMTADEFDAWMKANGIRIAKGNPADSAAKKGKKAAVKSKAAATKATAPSNLASAGTGG